MENKDVGVSTVARESVDAAIARARAASPLLTLPEVAAYLRCSVGSVRELIHTGKIARLRSGKRDMILRSDLDAYVERARTRAVDPIAVAAGQERRVKRAPARRTAA